MVEEILCLAGIDCGATGSSGLLDFLLPKVRAESGRFPSHPDFKCLLASYWRGNTQVKPPEGSDVGRYETIAGPLRELLEKSGDLFSELDRQILRDDVFQIAARVSLWNSSPKNATAEKKPASGL